MLFIMQLLPISYILITSALRRVLFFFFFLRSFVRLVVSFHLHFQPSVITVYDVGLGIKQAVNQVAIAVPRSLIADAPHARLCTIKENSQKLIWTLWRTMHASH